LAWVAALGNQLHPSRRLNHLKALKDTCRSLMRYKMKDDKSNRWPRSQGYYIL
jgi:hypothetical protein